MELSNISTKLEGKKTYIVLFTTILYAATRYWAGEIGLDTVFEIILGTGVLAGFRAAISESIRLLDKG